MVYFTMINFNESSNHYLSSIPTRDQFLHFLLSCLEKRRSFSSPNLWPKLPPWCSLKSWSSMRNEEIRCAYSRAQSFGNLLSTIFHEFFQTSNSPKKIVRDLNCRPPMPWHSIPYRLTTMAPSFSNVFVLRQPNF